MTVLEEQITPKRKWGNLITILTIGVLLIIVGLVSWNLFSIANETPRGAAVEEITKGILEDNQKDIAKLISINYEEYRDNTKRWSLAYYSCVFLAAIFSALAGVILKLEYFAKNDGLKKDVAALLAVTAALLVAISTNGDFQRKWQANRVAASGMENLAYDLLKKPFTDDNRTKIVSEVQEINLKRNQEIVGEGKPTSKTQDTQKGNKKENVDNSNKDKDTDKQENSNANK